MTRSFQESWPEPSVEESQETLNHLVCIPLLNPWSWKSSGLSQGHVHLNGARAPICHRAQARGRRVRAVEQPKANLFTAQAIKNCQLLLVIPAFKEKGKADRGLFPLLHQEKEKEERGAVRLKKGLKLIQVSKSQSSLRIT